MNAKFKPKYCSVRCRSEHLKRTGSAAPNYKHGWFTKQLSKKYRNTYSYKETEFRNISKAIKDDIVLLYGRLVCERCKAHNTNIWDVHHIIYRSEAPKHPNLHNRNNLILLCRDCHAYYHSRKANRSELIKSRKLYELFDHIKPCKQH